MTSDMALTDFSALSWPRDGAWNPPPRASSRLGTWGAPSCCRGVCALWLGSGCGPAHGSGAAARWQALATGGDGEIPGFHLFSAGRTAHTVGR